MQDLLGLFLPLAARLQGIRARNAIEREQERRPLAAKMVVYKSKESIDFCHLFYFATASVATVEDNESYTSEGDFDNFPFFSLQSAKVSKS